MCSAPFILIVMSSLAVYIQLNLNPMLQIRKINIVTREKLNALLLVVGLVMMLAVLAYEILYFQKWFKSDHGVAINSLSTYAEVCHNLSLLLL